jgi:hypothetical protein
MDLYRAEKVEIVAHQSSKRKQSHQPTRHASHTDANREFQEPPLLEKLIWFVAALLAFTAISFVYMQNWG